jgi:hypothetical protein
MDTVFENKITLKKRAIYEYMKATTKKMARIYTGVSGILFLIVAVIQYSYGDISTSIWSLILSALIFLSPIFAYRFASTRYYKQLIVLTGGTEMKKTTKFTDDKIDVISSNKAESSFKYEQISHVYETKKLMILKVSRQICILLDKNNFTIGNIEEFEKFISFKCPSARFIHR